MREMTMPLGTRTLPDARYPAHGEPIARPSWVIVGVELGGSHVRLFASDSLTEGELKMIAGEPEFDPDTTLIYTMPPPRIFLTLEMKKFVMIDAVDWATAFRSLFERWAPGDGPRLAIGPG